MEIKNIGILTSGGDSPGMNAAIRAVVRTCLYHDIRVFGIRNGFKGLVEGDVFDMNAGSVGDIIHKGGTMLRSARLDAYRTDIATRQMAYETARRFQMDGIIILGGDGSFRGGLDMANESKLAIAGVPCTIDNDLPYTEFTIGFDTAVNTCVDAINNLRDTMASHDRVAVVEVMGRNCGDIAIYSGIAAGAEAILVPEQRRTEAEHLEYIMKKLNFSAHRGKRYGIILMAEGVSRSKGDEPHFTPEAVAEWLSRQTSDTGVAIDARGVVLGHIQRGGPPTSTDRILASRLGAAAVEVMLGGKRRNVVGLVHNEIVDYDIKDALAMKRPDNMRMIELADSLAM